MKNKMILFVIASGLLNYTDMVFGMEPNSAMQLAQFKESQEKYKTALHAITSQMYPQLDPDGCLHVSEHCMLCSLPTVEGFIIKEDHERPNMSVLYYLDSQEKKWKRELIEHKVSSDLLSKHDLTVFNKKNTRPLFILKLIKGKLPYKETKQQIFVANGLDQLLKALGACYSEYPLIVIGGAVFSISTVAMIALIIHHIGLQFPKK
jgi:hypothetical protein